MALSLTQTTQFKIKELTLISKLGEINITNIYQEINIFENVFVPNITGDIVINDAVGLADRLVLDGSEFVKMQISKTGETGPTSFEKIFRITSLSNRKNINQTSEYYILHISSEEAIYSLQQKINQNYTGVHSDIVKKILVDKLKVPAKRIAFMEPTSGIHSVIIPNLSPFDAIDWVIKKAINNEGLPNFFFFENKNGFNFVSLSTLVGSEPIATINFNPKNIKESLNTNFLSARDMQVVNQFNYLDNITNGVYSGKFIGIDPLTRQVKTTKLSFLETYNKTKKHLNKYPNFTGASNRDNKMPVEMFDSKVSLYPFSSLRAGTPYIATNDPKTGQIIDSTHSYVFQRAPILANLLQLVLHINLPGNFGLTCGAVVDVRVPSRSIRTDKQDILDDTLSGKYLITACRHMITPQKHITILEVAADSTNKVFSTKQTNSMIGASKV